MGSPEPRVLDEPFQGIRLGGALQYQLRARTLGRSRDRQRGLRPRHHGYVDLVVTPVGGLGMILLKDYLDKKLIRKLEQGKSTGQARLLRVILNPQRSIANLLRFKRPSHRDTRGLP